MQAVDLLRHGVVPAPPRRGQRSERLLHQPPMRRRQQIEAIQAYLHDARRLPPEIKGDVGRLCPRAHAAPALEELEEAEDLLEARGRLTGKDERA